MEEENKALVLRVIEGFLNSADPELADELFRRDFVDHNPSNPEMGGLENMKRSVADWHRAFPDTVNEVRDLLAEGDRVAARWVTRGTHRGTFLGVPATGNRVEVTSSGVFRISEGRVAESWDHFDALGMLGQLGVAFEPKGDNMSLEVNGVGARQADPAGPRVEGKGIKRVRPGSEDRTVPQGVFGLDAISRATVGAEGIFMGRYRVPPGAHSSLHVHTNCETAVYVLRGRGYAYAGEDMDEYLEAGPGDFFHIPADLAHVVGCPAGGEPLEYVVSRNAPEEVVVTLRAAADLPIGPDGRMRDV